MQRAKRAQQILDLYNITKNENQKTIYQLDTSIKENMQILKNSIYKDNIGLRRKYMILHGKV